MTVSKLLNVEIDFAINNHRKYCILITYIKIEQLNLKEFEKKQAKAYCEEIITKIDTWQKNKTYKAILN